MSSVRYGSGRQYTGQSLVSDTQYPPQRDPATERGAWAIAQDGTMVWSDGNEWYGSAPKGSEVLLPPWAAIPDGWFEVPITLDGALGNRTLISNQFNINYVIDGVSTWPIVDPGAMYTDAAGTQPVTSAPSPVGLLEDSNAPTLDWYQDVSIDRPTWIEVTRTVDGVEKTVDAISFDGLGQQLKVDFPETVTGSMVHFTSSGPYIAGVEIPAGTYESGTHHIWNIEEIILFDRFLTANEADELIREIGRQRDRVTEQNFGTNWTNAFRGRSEIKDLSYLDFSEVTVLRSTFAGINDPDNSLINQNLLFTATSATDFRNIFQAVSVPTLPAGMFANCAAATNFGQDIVSGESGAFRNINVGDRTIPSGFFSGTPNVTTAHGLFSRSNVNSLPDDLFSYWPNLSSLKFSFLIADLNSIPAGLFDNNPNVTDFLGTFYVNNLTSIPAGLFDNNPNVTDFSRTFRDNSITSIPSGLFDNNPNVTNFFGTFAFNSLTSIPAGLFDNNPNVTTFIETFRDNSLTSIPAGLFDNNPNVTSFVGTFRDNSLTSIPAGLFDTQTQCTGYNRIFEGNDLDQTSVDNVLVSIQTSADANNLNDGTLGINGGTNATPSATGQAAADALRARGWTVNLNGY